MEGEYNFFIYKMDLNQATSLSTPDILSCDHQNKIESVEEIIEDLNWKVGVLDKKIEEVQNVLSNDVEFFEKWDPMDRFSSEKLEMEIELLKCQQIILETQRKAEAEKCFCLKL